MAGDKPAAGVVVETCSYSSWGQTPEDASKCLVHQVETTGTDGKFHLSERHHREYVIAFGEAPLIVTVVSACNAAHDQLAAVKLGFDIHQTDLTLDLAPIATAKPTVQGTGRARVEGTLEYAVARCRQ